MSGLSLPGIHREGPDLTQVERRRDVLRQSRYEFRDVGQLLCLRLLLEDVLKPIRKAVNYTRGVYTIKIRTTKRDFVAFHLTGSNALRALLGGIVEHAISELSRLIDNVLRDVRPTLARVKS